MTELPTLPARHRWPVDLRYGPLRLRPLRRRDQRAWFEVRQRNWDWLREWEPTSPPSNPQQPLTFTGLVRKLRRDARDNKALPFALTWESEGESERLIGQISMSGIVAGSGQYAQVGYWIDEEYAGLGIVPFAVAAVCDYGFFVMGLHRIEIVIRPENAKSLRVIEKLGFREEGGRPEYLHINGEWRDHRVFALHRDEVGSGLMGRCPRPRI
ncbi:MAG: GNAT family N-acetyltransferase [Propionibacteriaceae bacterium]